MRAKWTLHLCQVARSTRAIAALSPSWGVGDHQLDAVQAALDQALEEGAPESFRFRRPDVQADDLAAPLRVGGHRHYGRDTHDPATLALLQIRRVQPQVGPLAAERAVEERAHALVDVPAQLAHRALADARQPHRLHEIVDLAGGHAADPRFLDHRDQGALGGLPRL